MIMKPKLCIGRRVWRGACLAVGVPGVFAPLGAVWAAGWAAQRASGFALKLLGRSWEKAFGGKEATP
jgi:hypothetical protein